MRHTSLDTTQRQIRLLHLHPGNAKEDLVCHFSIVSLDDHNLEYEALSYVWGTSTGKYVVCVDDTPHPVTDNLWQALAILRHKDKDRVLWVDAVCIDQSNNDERCNQVSQMHSIYSQASSVEIALGDAFPDIELALQLFTEFAAGITAEGRLPSYAPFETFWDGLNGIDETIMNADDRKALRTLDAIYRFMTRTWWDRTWTIQEFILAKKSTFHCGEHTLDGTVLLQCVWHLANHNESCCPIILPLEWRVMLAKLLEPVQSVQMFKRGHMDFLRCVGNFRSRKATDPRDKIYGLLGLGLDNTTDFVRPDYNLSVEEAFETFVISNIKHTQSLHVFSHLRNERQRNYALPSYVPDWTMDLSHVSEMEMAIWIVRHGLLDLYNACAGLKAEFTSIPGVLFIRGRIVDRVGKIASRNLDSTAQSSHHNNEFLDEVLGIAKVPPVTDDQDLARRRAFWTTMRAGIITVPPIQPQRSKGVGIRSPPILYGRLRACLGSDEHSEFEKIFRTADLNNRQQIARLNDNVVARCVMAAHAGRNFMATQRGCIGLIPSCAKEGDVVAVLTGGRVPIILRPENNYYTIVGDAYVHGMMDGEAMQDTNKLEYIELH